MLAEIFGVDGIIVLVVVFGVLFGSSQIPKLARSLGSAQKEFKKGIAEGAGAPVVEPAPVVVPVTVPATVPVTATVPATATVLTECAPRS